MPFPSPGDLPHPGVEPKFLASPTLAGGFFTRGPPGKPNLVPLNNIRMGERASLYKITTSCLGSPEGLPLWEGSLFVSFAVEAGTPHIEWSRMGCARCVGRGGQSGQVQV